MLTHEILRSEGVLVLTPGAPLEASDFQELAKEIDPYIEQNGKLHGLLVEAKAFPGWKDFAAFFAHLKFVKNHHQKLEKVAIVSDSSVLTIGPEIVSHFIQAKVRHFSSAQRAEAVHWLSESTK
jgi:SpoIIAA-like